MVEQRRALDRRRLRQRHNTFPNQVVLLTVLQRAAVHYDHTVCIGAAWPAQACLLLPLLSQLGDIADVGLLLLHLLLLALRLYSFAELLVLTLLLPKQQHQHIQSGPPLTQAVFVPLKCNAQCQGQQL